MECVQKQNGEVRVKISELKDRKIEYLIQTTERK